MYKYVFSFDYITIYLYILQISQIVELFICLNAVKMIIIIITQIILYILWVLFNNICKYNYLRGKLYFKIKINSDSYKWSSRWMRKFLGSWMLWDINTSKKFWLISRFRNDGLICYTKFCQLSTFNENGDTIHLILFKKHAFYDSTFEERAEGLYFILISENDRWVDYFD